MAMVRLTIMMRDPLDSATANNQMSTLALTSVSSISNLISMPTSPSLRVIHGFKTGKQDGLSKTMVISTRFLQIAGTAQTSSMQIVRGCRVNILPTGTMFNSDIATMNLGDSEIQHFGCIM